MGNKGFSLVELIVVIAIMVVLVAVLAPVFTRYVERSRRATDVQNANSIAESVLTDVASDELNANSGEANPTNITSIQSTPVAQGSAAKDNSFFYEYDPDTNTVQVFIGNGAAGSTTAAATGCPNLTDAGNAADYTAARGSNFTAPTTSTPSSGS